MVLQPKSFEVPDTFHCRALARHVSIFQCMALYVDANALNRCETPCFKCIKGTEVRVRYAKG